MTLAVLDADADPRDVYAAVKAAFNGSGGPVLLGGSVARAGDLPAGTIAVVTTSGSTGVPKSVVLSRASLTASALSTMKRVGEGAWMLALPATYVAGLQVLVRSVIGGHEPTFLSGHFTTDAFIRAAADMARVAPGVPRYTSLVPAQLQTIVEEAEDPAVVGAARSFTAILVGGQALPAALSEHAEALGIRVVRTYGSSETAGGCVYDQVPLEFVRARTVDGEIQLAGPMLADGYWGDAALTDATFVRDGDDVRWYRTGDAGSVEDGLVTVTGRIDNVLISGGVNVSIDRVERAVRSVPGAERGVIVAADDDRWGQVPVLVVEADRAGLLEEARAAAEVAVGVAGRPARVVVMVPLPTLTSGKPDRRTITARL